MNKNWVIIPIVVLVLAIPFAAAKGNPFDALERSVERLAVSVASLIAHDAAQDARLDAIETYLDDLHDAVPAAPGFYTGDPGAVGDAPDVPPDFVPPPVET